MKIIMMWLLKSASPSEVGSGEQNEQINMNISNESRQSFDSEEERLVQASGKTKRHTYSLNRIALGMSNSEIKEWRIELRDNEAGIVRGSQNYLIKSAVLWLVQRSLYYP